MSEMTAEQFVMAIESLAHSVVVGNRWSDERPKGLIEGARAFASGRGARMQDLEALKGLTMEQLYEMSCTLHGTPTPTS